MSGSVEDYQTGKGRQWMVRYRDENNRPRTRKGFKTKRDATLYLADLQVKTARGEWIDPQSGKVTVGSLGEDWLAAQGHLKQTTQANLESTWRLHVKPRWDNEEVGRIRPSAVRSWVAELQANDVGVTVLERALGILRQLLEHAVQDRRLPSNPAAGVKLPRRQHNPRGYLTHRQVNQLANEVGSDGVVVLFLAYTGLRWGELAALRLCDFDVLRRRVNIQRACAEARGQVVFSTPKTHERRTVPFPAFLAELVAPRMEGKGRDDLVFTTAAGGILRVSNWRPRVFNPAVNRCQQQSGDFPKVSPHDLRHTAASLAISAGANVKAVQTMLGHASAAMTLDTYADLFPDDLEAVAGALELQRAKECALAVPYKTGETY